MSLDTFRTRDRLDVGGRGFEIRRLDALADRGLDVSELPRTRRILVENLLRHEDGVDVDASHVAAAAMLPGRSARVDVPFRPARVLLQDFTGVPAVVDLAAMRDVVARFGGDPRRIHPLLPVDLVVDHSIQVDAYGSDDAFRINQELDYSRNRERYELLAWARSAFRGFRVVPPNTGIVHQVNLERLARIVYTSEDDTSYSGPLVAYPDTLVGTDSHTPMVNGLGVLGFGVGGIEAEAAMLGEPIGMLVPRVLGVRLTGGLRDGVTATDLVLTITERLRARGVVGWFVEFVGAGLDALDAPARATVANMCPEYGATAALFPVDDATLGYLATTGRTDEHIALVERYMRVQGLFRERDEPELAFDDVLELDLGAIEPSIAGPRRPQERVELSRAGESFRGAVESLRRPGRAAPIATADSKHGSEATPWGEGSAASPARVERAGSEALRDGHVVIAAITSCTNTSNPDVMLAAGLLAKKANERGLRPPPWVKTSLAPGSRAVREHLDRAGLTPHLDALGFHLVGYGCTTCIGNSGPLSADVSRSIDERGLVVAAVLSGNRNFEGRIHSQVRANYLMSPPLVVAFALAGRVDLDPTRDPIAVDASGRPVMLGELWPRTDEIADALRRAVSPETFHGVYRDLWSGDAAWAAIQGASGARFDWDPRSTYVRPPSFFDRFELATPEPPSAWRGARALVVLGDGVTTDHVSPAGSIAPDSPAGAFLRERGVDPAHFNSYGARRGNHEVMMRGTFASPRLRNVLVDGREGHWTRHLPTGEEMTIFDAARRYAADDVPLVVFAGEDYGSGSSRDWAAKGPRLLGVKAVIAKSFERIHRSNLVGMGILPLEFAPGQSLASLGLDGTEAFDIEGLTALTGPVDPTRSLQIVAHRADGSRSRFLAFPRIDTPREALYFASGGILDFVLRRILTGTEVPAPSPASPAQRAERAAKDVPHVPVASDVDRAAAQSFPASDPPAH